jgi:hypothetical protein
MKIRQADSVRTGVEACLMEVFGSVRTEDFYIETTNDESYGRYLYKAAVAKASSKSR